MDNPVNFEGMVKFYEDGRERICGPVATHVRGWVSKLTIGNVRPLAVVDVDGVIRNGKDRLGLLPSKELIKSCADAGEANLAWKAFNDASGQDQPIPEVIAFLKELSKTWAIVFLTSTTYSAQSFHALLGQLDHWDVPWDGFFMRGEDNHLSPVDMKVHWFERMKHSIPRGTIFIDDCPKNCAAIRKLGYVALQPMDWQEAK